MTAQEVEKKILNCLEREYPTDLSIEEIAAKTRIHRNTVSKYVFGLEKEGRVKISRIVGRAKMYVVSKK
jgi:DNA-binding Lrp family transcriptional regulator